MFHNRILSKKAIPYYLIILFSLVIVLPQLLTHSFVGGLDSYFHMNSIYEDAMQIKHLKFSYFMSMFGFDQSGRIVNALYGPIFNYLAGLILLVCHSWFIFSAVSSFLVVSISGIGMYILMKEMAVQSSFATILSGLYMISHPIISSWVGNQEYTGLSACILPFVFIVGIRIARTSHIHLASIILIMTIALQTHLLTALISAILLILFFFYGSFRSAHVPHFYFQAFKAAILTFILNANIFAGMYEVFFFNKTIPTNPQNNFQINGLSVMQLGLGTLGLMFVTFFLALIFEKHNHLNHMIIIIGLLFLFLSSSYFPWNSLIKAYPFLQMTIQFPQRFAPIFWVTFYLIVGIYFSRFAKVQHQVIYPYIAWLIIIIAICFRAKPVISYLEWLPKPFYRPQVVRYINSTHYASKNHNKIRKYFLNNDLKDGIYSIQKSTPDYMPTTAHITANNYLKLPLYWHMYHNIMFNPMTIQKKISNNKIQLKWNSSKAKVVTLPVVAYAHTQVSFNKKHIRPHTNIIGAIKVKPHTGQNILSIQYQPNLLTKLLMSIMIISWLLVIGWWCYIGFTKKRY